VRFVAVYITEAHAADEWPVGKTISFCNQPKTMAERLDLAAAFVKKHDYRVPMMVDSMHNSFHDVFACWPFRYYVIQHGHLIHKAEPAPKTFHYDITTILPLLQRLTKDE